VRRGGHFTVTDTVKNQGGTAAGSWMIGLETAYAVVKTILPELSEEKLISMLSTNPRKIFGLEQSVIETGKSCSVTLFNPNMTWEFTETDIKSKSKNTPFIGKTFTGKPIGIINGEKLFLNN
jgi:dihydroorotase